MKYICFIIFIAMSANAQKDKNGNPVFNSVTLKEEVHKDYVLSANYYTLANNIDNSSSSVYMADKPTLDQVERAALNLPSYHFSVLRDRAAVTMVLITIQPKLQYLVVNMANRKQLTFPFNLKGDIPETRALELIKEKYDPNAKISGNELVFNNKKYKIIPEKDIFRDVISLITKEKLYEGPASDRIILSQDEIKAYILTESKEGGELDFFTAIKGHEYDGVQIKPGVFDTKYGLALYQWGRANFELGVNTLDDAYSIWAEHKGKPVSKLDAEYIKLGFLKQLEK